MGESVKKKELLFYFKELLKNHFNSISQIFILADHPQMHSLTIRIGLNRIFLFRAILTDTIIFCRSNCKGPFNK